MERRVCLLKRLLAILVFSLLLVPPPDPHVWAGPPFVTDDPETVDYRHGEFTIASQYANNTNGKEATLPHFEFNYGPMPDLQLHLLIPFAYVHPDGDAASYGLGDTEVGVKYRFLHETNSFPQAATFPLVHIPTGDSERGLGSGHTQFFLPLWLQKSWGPWTTYGGGGYWTNPGDGNRNFWQLGWLVQREAGKGLTLGAEIFYFSKDRDEGSDRTGYGIGGIFDLSEAHHILFSAGSDITGDNRFAAYLGYLWTFGPRSGGPHGDQDNLLPRVENDPRGNSLPDARPDSP